MNNFQHKVIPKIIVEQTDAESTTTSPELDPATEPSNINIPRQWRHGASFSNEFIIGNLKKSGRKELL